MKPLLWFLLTGVCGFLIDAGLTHLIILAGLEPILARIPALIATMGFIWFVNRRRILAKSTHSVPAEGFRYWTVGITSALLNYAVYSVLLYRAPFLQPIVGIVAAWLAATAYGFFGYSRFVFRHSRDQA
jgi:putative flippase GtrA